MKSFINDDYLSTKFYSTNVDGTYSKIDEGLYLKVNMNTESKLYGLRERYLKDSK